MVKSTEDFENEIIETSNLPKLLYDNETLFFRDEFYILLERLLIEKGVRKSEAIKNSMLSKDYGYQIFSGIRNPSRDKLIQLSFGLQLDLEETNRFLKVAGLSPLYPKNRRDACLIYCKKNDFSLIRSNQLLFELGEKALFED